MPSDPRHPTPYSLSSLMDKSSLAKLAVIAVIILGIAGAFAGTAGWLSPDLLTPRRIVDAFEQANGHHPGFRRNHAKGVCIIGSFAGNGQGTRLSKAVIFQPGDVPVIGRFALASAVPDTPDGPKNVRSMALSFRPANGQEWRTGMNDIPVFPFPTPRDLYELLVATTPDPASGKPDPDKIKAYFASHPKTAQAIQTIGATPFPSGFANGSYNGLDAFRFVNAEGVVTPVRWAMVAGEPFAPEDANQTAADKNYLFTALAARLKQSPLQWHLIVTIGQPSDPTNDASIAWPDSREKVDVGTLTIDRAETEAPGTCRDINYDPLVLPDGIEPSDDPLLSARSAAYAQSFMRRSGEAKQPSAVQLNDPAKAP